MTKTVIFSKHAAERLYQRCGVFIKHNTPVSIPNDFFVGKTYTQNSTGNQIKVYANKNQKMPVALIVDATNSVVVTVYIGTALSGRNSNFMSDVYSNLPK